MKKQKGYRENKAMDSMKYMNYFMVVMVIFMAYSMETAMSIYWITTSTITILSLIHISEPTRRRQVSRMPSAA